MVSLKWNLLCLVRNFSSWGLEDMSHLSGPESVRILAPWTPTRKEPEPKDEWIQIASSSQCHSVWNQIKYNILLLSSSSFAFYWRRSGSLVVFVILWIKSIVEKEKAKKAAYTIVFCGVWFAFWLEENMSRNPLIWEFYTEHRNSRMAQRIVLTFCEILPWTRNFFDSNILHFLYRSLLLVDEFR